MKFIRRESRVPESVPANILRYCFLSNSMISRWRINGFRRLFVFNSLCRLSTTVAPSQPRQNPFLLVDYLINTFGLSKEEAQSSTKKVTVNKSCRYDPDLVVNYFKSLGLDRNQIKTVICAYPKLLTCKVDKSLKSRVLALQEIGILGSDLIRVLMVSKYILARGPLTRSIEYLRNLLGSNENVAEVIKKYSCVTDYSACKVIESNVKLLEEYGLSRKTVSRLMLENPRCFIQTPARLQDILYMVENEFGIPRNSVMFYYGISAASTISRKTIDMKIRVLRSFGFSDLTVYGMIKKFPTLVRTSEDKMRKTWDFFVEEIGCDPVFLASYPNVFNFSLEKRVIPRYEFMKTLKEKNLTNRKPGLYKLLNLSESNFVNQFVLPHKDEIPDMVDSYFKTAGRKKT